MIQPLVSVIVINHNGKKYIKRCIEAIVKNSYKNIELIIIDNASNDGSVGIIKKLHRIYPILPMRCIFLKKNYGPNVGRNIGIEKSRGEFCLFVDHDAIINKDCIASIVSFLAERPEIGAVQVKLILMDNPKKIDTCGTYLTPFGFICEPSHGEPISTYNNYMSILGGRGVFMIRRSILRKIGIFNQSFFLGWDETELFWRIWLAGYKVIFLPQATAYHARSSKAKINYEGFKNGCKTFIKLLELKNLIPILFVYTLGWFCLIVMVFGRDKSALLKILSELKSLMKDLPNILMERKVIQRMRQTKDKFIFHNTLVCLPLRDFFKRIKYLVS
ncbi:MAG: hypothetical protein C4294_18190 [Nitrospiraceae bacterium]